MENKKISIQPIELKNNENSFFIGKIDINGKDLLAKAFHQAILKSQHTNNLNQNNEKRSAYNKFEKQLQGIISEIIVVEYLKLIFNKEDNLVIRYDDVRLDEFKSPQNEYDIKLKFEKNEYDIEVRSSLSYKKEMDYNNLKNFDVLGPYSNKMKKNEAYSDYYIRPILQLKNPSSNLDIKNISISENLINDNFDFYITGGCNKLMMMNSGFLKELGQKNTSYQIIPVLKSLDIKSLTNDFRILKNNNEKTLRNKIKP